MQLPLLTAFCGLLAPAGARTEVRSVLNANAAGEDVVTFSFRKGNSAYTVETSTIHTATPMPTLVYHCANMPHICRNVAEHHVHGAANPRVLTYDPHAARKELRGDLACPTSWALGKRKPYVDGATGKTTRRIDRMPDNALTAADLARLYGSSPPKCPDAGVAALGVGLPPGTWWSCDEFPARSTMEGGGGASSVCASQNYATLGFERNPALDAAVKAYVNPLWAGAWALPNVNAQGEQDRQAILHKALGARPRARDSPQALVNDGRLHKFVLSLDTAAPSGPPWGKVIYARFDASTTTIQPPPGNPLQPATTRTTVTRTSVTTDTVVRKRAVAMATALVGPEGYLVKRGGELPGRGDGEDLVAKLGAALNALTGLVPPAGTSAASALVSTDSAPPAANPSEPPPESTAEVAVPPPADSPDAPAASTPTPPPADTPTPTPDSTTPAPTPSPTHFSTSTIPLTASTVTAITTRLSSSDHDTILPVWPILAGTHGCTLPLFCGIVLIPALALPAGALIAPPWPELPQISIGSDGQATPTTTNDAPTTTATASDEPTRTAVATIVEQQILAMVTQMVSDDSYQLSVSGASPVPCPPMPANRDARLRRRGAGLRRPRWRRRRRRAWERGTERGVVEYGWAGGLLSHVSGVLWNDSSSTLSIV
ncbi:hypothetical protein EDC01DRAFT_647593 [Geopyxis carbonaria]|nr:hypothetical protein EDC01DRAFT_647593 [Geopyxis carbonaria]